MPKLLAFLPCERVVIGGESDNTASVIAIMQGFTVEGEVPSDSEDKHEALPFSWTVFALWESGDDDDSVYQHRTELISPNGKSLWRIEGALQFHEGKRFHRLITKLGAFPLDGVGDYFIKHYLKVGDGEFAEHASFPIPMTVVITSRPPDTVSGR